MSDNEEIPRIQFSMSPMYALDMLTALTVAEENDPTFSNAIRRFMVCLRSSGYTEDTLVNAAMKQINERMSTGGDDSTKEEAP
jgi:hypothetical protein